ncbi:hypothetical protein A225_0077 [Klebsiella michiganensis E718]|nr:hypothetical protein A225_0077 [Klebsiella michiganensis E718]
MCEPPDCAVNGLSGLPVCSPAATRGTSGLYPRWLRTAFS